MRKIFFAILICTVMMLSCGAAAAEDEYWITIDPVQQPQTGDLYLLTGSTNIPADTAIVLKIYRYDGTQPTPDEKIIQPLPAAFTTTIVARGDEPVRNWSVNGPVPESLPAGNYGYIAAAYLMYDEENPLAAEPLPKPDIWAAAYSVPDRITGDIIRISGTTNLPEGDTIRVEVTQTGGQTPVFSREAAIVAGDNRTNTWTVVMNTAGFSLGTYAVTLPGVRHQQGPVFRLSPATDVSPWWISIDPLYDQNLNNSFPISGATNLAAGTPLRIVIQSAGYSVTGPDYPKAFTGTATVQEGDGGIHFWSITADIRSVPEDEYEVTVIDPETKTKAWDYLILSRTADTPQDTFWITMNEVRMPDAKKPYVFSGSTTVPLGTDITLEVRRIDTTVSGIPDDFSSYPKIHSTSTVVRGGENGVNHWATATTLLPEQVSEKNVRYVVIARPQEFSRVAPVTRVLPGTGDRTTVDPIPDGVLGDQMVISGRTTYPPGEWIAVALYEVTWKATPDQKPADAVVTETVMVDKDSRWSLLLDTQNLSLGTYTILADDAPYLSGPVFSLKTAAEHLWITVDPIPLVRKGDNFTISGTTGLDAGIHLLIEILPYSFLREERAHDSRSYSIISGMAQAVQVQKGEGDKNYWSVPVHTEKWRADTYEMKVSALEVDLTHREDFVLYPADYTVPVPETTTQAASGLIFTAGVPGVLAAALFLRRR